jgi:transcription antitermination factor NusG
MMHYRDVKPGDTLPWTPPRKPLGPAAVAPAWYVVTAGRQRQQMVAARAWLTINGAQDAWFPEHTEHHFRRGKRAIVERPQVPGIVFVRLDLEPQWDVMQERRGLRPLKIGDAPVCVTDAVMARMAEIPGRIAQLIEAARLKVGDHADIAEGLLHGVVRGVVTVLEIRRDGVRVRLPTGAEVWLPAAQLRKVGK